MEAPGCWKSVSTSDLHHTQKNTRHAVLRQRPEPTSLVIFVEAYLRTHKCLSGQCIRRHGTQQHVMAGPSYCRRSALIACLSILASVVPVASAAMGPLRTGSNGRYFSDSNGRAVYLTGSHVWT